MPYSVTDDVQALIPTTIWNHDGAAPDPTDAQVTTWIAEVDREIDAIIVGRYATPITGTQSLAIIQSISARIVAIRVWGKVFTGQTGAPDHPEDWGEARPLLYRLASGKDGASLPDAPGAGVGETSPGSPISSFRTLAADPNAGVEAQPIFTMDQDW
jgi:hypothetical protein